MFNNQVYHSTCRRVTKIISCFDQRSALKIEPHSETDIPLAIRSGRHQERRLGHGGDAKIDKPRSVAENSRIKDIPKLDHRPEPRMLVDSKFTRDAKVERIKTRPDSRISRQVTALCSYRLERELVEQIGRD